MSEFPRVGRGIVLHTRARLSLCIGDKISRISAFHLPCTSSGGAGLTRSSNSSSVVPSSPRLAGRQRQCREPMQLSGKEET